MRFKHFAITPELIMEIVRTGSRIPAVEEISHWMIDSGFPEDSVIHDVKFRQNPQVIHILVATREGVSPTSIDFDQTWVSDLEPELIEVTTFMKNERVEFPENEGT